MAVEDTIKGVILTAMPPGADAIISTADGVVTYFVSWPLLNDPARPNKPSKTIAIKFSVETMQDLAHMGSQQLGANVGRLLSYLNERMTGFDPDHQSPREVPPPVEVWVPFLNQPLL